MFSIAVLSSATENAVKLVVVAADVRSFAPTVRLFTSKDFAAETATVGAVSPCSVVNTLNEVAVLPVANKLIPLNFSSAMFAN